MKKEIVLALALGLLLFAPAVVVAQQTITAPPLSALPDLVGGLRATAGCLGVETARTSSGKQVIFAWFENKKAALAWYYSDTHLGAMRMMGAKPGATPMADVPDDGLPVLAVASITLASNPSDTTHSMAISQIGIELYRPLPGGIAVGGRFAPSTLNVPGLRDVPMSAATATK